MIFDRFLAAPVHNRRVQYNDFVERRMTLYEVGTVVLEKSGGFGPSRHFFTRLVD